MSELIERYTPNQRVNHWFTAITFILLALSGLALFHPSMFWLTNLLGGGTWTRILHPFIGVAMFVSFLGLTMSFWSHNTFAAGDGQWLARWRDVVNNREDGLLMSTESITSISFQTQFQKLRDELAKKLG